MHIIMSEFLIFEYMNDFKCMLHYLVSVFQADWIYPQMHHDPICMHKKAKGEHRGSQKSVFIQDCQFFSVSSVREKCTEVPSKLFFRYCEAGGMPWSNALAQDTIIVSMALWWISRYCNKVTQIRAFGCGRGKIKGDWNSGYQSNWEVVKHRNYWKPLSPIHLNAGNFKIYNSESHLFCLVLMNKYFLPPKIMDITTYAAADGNESLVQYLIFPLLGIFLTSDVFIKKLLLNKQTKKQSNKQPINYVRRL